VEASPFANIEAIKQLKARYFRLLDTQDWSGWAEVFSEEATLQWGPKPHHVMSGRDAIVKGVRGNLCGASTCHHGHMPEIELVDAAHARGIWAMHDIVDHPDYLLEGYGHYYDEYVKQEGRWRIRPTKRTRLREPREPRGSDGR
jgi:hypothetical protein